MTYRRLVADWPQIVGPALGAHVVPRSLRNGVLTIACTSSPVALELQHILHKLGERVNACRPHERPITTVRLVLVLAKPMQPKVEELPRRRLYSVQTVPQIGFLVDIDGQPFVVTGLGRRFRREDGGLYVYAYLRPHFRKIDRQQYT